MRLGTWFSLYQGQLNRGTVEGRSRCATDVLPLMARMAEQSSEKEMQQRNKELKCLGLRGAVLLESLQL